METILKQCESCLCMKNMHPTAKYCANCVCGVMMLTPTPEHDGGMWCAEKKPCVFHSKGINPLSCCGRCGKMEAGAHACKKLPEYKDSEVIIEDGNTGESHTLAEEINNCDGCQRGLDTLTDKYGSWHEETRDGKRYGVMGCTKERYEDLEPKYAEYQSPVPPRDPETIAKGAKQVMEAIEELSTLEEKKCICGVSLEKHANKWCDEVNLEECHCWESGENKSTVPCSHGFVVGTPEVSEWEKELNEICGEEYIDAVTELIEKTLAAARARIAEQVEARFNRFDEVLRNRMGNSERQEQRYLTGYDDGIVFVLHAFKREAMEIISLLQTP